MAFIVNSSSRRSTILSKLISIYLFFLAPAFADKLELSADNGHTWQSFDTPLLDPPHTASIRLLDHPSTVLHLPSCAFKGSLRVQVWRTKASDKPLGLRWQSSVCHPHLKLPNAITVEDIGSVRRKSDWLHYTHQRKQHDANRESDAQQKQSFFSKYGLYIMLFVGAVLGQGIRKGLAELHEEMEREESEKREKKTSRQIRVVVPKRKQSSKIRKKEKSMTAN